MSVPDINSVRDDLLVQLAERRATNGNPGNVYEICSQLRPDIDWTTNHDLARSAGWLLVRNTPPLAKTVQNSEKPGAMFLALTAAGKSAASEIYKAKQPLTFGQRARKIPVGKGLWKIAELGLAAIAGAVATKYLGK